MTTATARTIELDKGPRETSVIRLDFSSWLIEQGTTLKQWSTQVSPARPGGLKVASIDQIGDELELMLTGGVLGEAYQVSLDVIGQNSASMDMAMAVRVRGTSEDQVAGSDGTVIVRPLISVPSVTVAEAAGYAVAAVTLSVPAIDDISAMATATPITASASDFSLPVQWSMDAVNWSPGPGLIVPAGSSTFFLRVAIVDDTQAEPMETVTLSVDVIDGSTQNSSSSGTITIVDDDLLPTLAVSSAVVDEGQPAAFVVTLSEPQSRTVTVAYSTRAGSASAADFTAVSGALSFAPGVTSQTITVPTTTDGFSESPEAFHVDLSAPVNARIAVGTGTGTIRLNQPAANTAGLNLLLADLGGGSYFLSV